MNAIIGLFCIGYGLLSLAARLFGWKQLFWKRDAMRERFGDRVGDLVHLIAYTIIPIAVGLLFLNR